MTASKPSAGHAPVTALPRARRRWAAHSPAGAGPATTAGEHRSRASVLLAALLVTSCTEIGPTVHVEPPPGKSEVAFDGDRATCTAEADRAVQPFSNRLNMDIGRNADQVGADNARIQKAYDERYAACMATRGDAVAGLPPPTTPAPGPDDAVGQAQEALALSPVMDAVSASAAGSVEAKVRNSGVLARARS